MNSAENDESVPVLYPAHINTPRPRCGGEISTQASSCPHPHISFCGHFHSLTDTTGVWLCFLLQAREPSGHLLDLVLKS